MKKRRSLNGMKGLAKKSILITIVAVIVIGIAGVFLTYYFSNKSGGNSVNITENIFLQKSFVSASEVPSDKLDFNPNAPQYNLPINVSSIQNLGSVLEKLGIKSIPSTLLSKNGFVAFETTGKLKTTEIYLDYSNGPTTADKDFIAFYKLLKENKIPIFITSDSVLHMFHLFFDLTLKKIEDGVFYQNMWDISKFMLDESIKDYNASSGDLKEAAKRNVAYSSVALSLLKPTESEVLTDEDIKDLVCSEWFSEEDCNQAVAAYKQQKERDFVIEDLTTYSFEVPAFVKDIVDKELSLINNHAGWDPSPIFIYKEDYSQYVPRGHYTSTNKLQNYFKAMMWFGRMTFLINGSKEIEPGKSVCGGADGIISTYDAGIQTMQSSLITLHFLSNEDVQKKWSSMYAITSFFVGISDDLGPEEYAKVLEDTLGKTEVNTNDIAKNIETLQTNLKALPYEPKIYSGLGECELVMPCPPLSDADIQNLKTEAKQLLAETKGFRMMGQRFTVDSWAFSEIVTPYSGEYTGEKTALPTTELPFTYTWNDKYPDNAENRPFTWVKTLVKFCGNSGREVRGFPRGLDLMAFLGSDRAYEILESIGDTQYSDYERQFKEIKSYFDGIQETDWYKNIYMGWLYSLKGLITKTETGYPTFMQTDAWADKELTAALASWAELRHDTILYVKQSYSMAEMGGGPEEEKPITGYVEPVPILYKRMINLVNLSKTGLDKLLGAENKDTIASIDDYLTNFANNLNRLYEISKKELTGIALDDSDAYFIEYFGETLDNLLKYIYLGQADSKLIDSIMVADVHTEGNTKLVLEEGTGYIDTMLVTYMTPDKKIYVGCGPVFSYYEFKQPMETRLTDEAWEEMLLKGNIPAEPSWTASYKGK